MKLYTTVRWVFLWSVLTSTAVLAQGNNKVSFFGGARAFFAQNNISGDAVGGDTTNASKANYGHTLIDLGINVKPNASNHVCAILRARNEFGGFYGNGATVKIRQLYAKGTIGNVLGYKVGDLDLKQSRFTLWNSKEENNLNESAVFSRLREVVYYENFYSKENTWRMQGGQLDFGFASGNEKNTFRLESFAVRNRIASNFIIPEELVTGASFQFERNKLLNLGLNYVNTFTIKNTSTSQTAYHNPVITGQLGITVVNKDNFSTSLKSEFGYSELSYTNESLGPAVRSGHVMEAGLYNTLKNSGVYVHIVFRKVSSDFFSAGAQTKRLNFNKASVLFPLLGNNSVSRSVGAWDYAIDPTLYNRGISSTLMTYNPVYGNTFAYGDATPNRQGLIISAGKLVDTSVIGFSLTNAYLSDIVGQGSLEQKNYLYLNAALDFNLGKLMGTKKKLLIKTGMQWDNASRGGDSIETMDFKSIQIDGGIEYEFANKFDLIYGLKTIQASGREYLVQRNEFNEIENYQRTDIDLSNIIHAAGVSYRFNNSMHLSFMTHQSKVKDKQNNLQYSLSRYFILYNLLF